MAGHQELFRVLLQSRYGLRNWFVPRGSVRFLRLQTFSNAAITPSAVRCGRNSCNPWNEARGNIFERAKVTHRRRKRWIPWQQATRKVRVLGRTTDDADSFGVLSGPSARSALCRSALKPSPSPSTTPSLGKKRNAGGRLLLRSPRAAASAAICDSFSAVKCFPSSLLNCVLDALASRLRKTHT